MKKITQNVYGFVGGSIIAGSFISGSEDGPALTGSGERTVQARNLSGVFNCLEVTGSVNIELKREDRNSIEVYGDSNLVDLIEIKLMETTLNIGFKRGISFVSLLPLKVVLSTPAIPEVVVRGSANVLLEGLDQENLKVELLGSGGVIAAGRVDYVALDLQGSGDIDTMRLVARKAFIKVQGSGDVRAFASDEVKARLHGSGDVHVNGGSRVRDSKVSGSGRIKFNQ
jgi:hypothetical protein